MKRFIHIIFALSLISFALFLSEAEAIAGKEKKSKKNQNNRVVYEKIVREGDDIELVVSGEGANQEEAIAGALRSAIEQTYGTFVSANTTLLNDDLIKNEIVTISSGNIKGYKIVSSNIRPNGETAVTLSAIVSIGKLISYVQSKGGQAEFAGQAFMMEMRMRELNKKNELSALMNLDKQIETMAHNLFDFSVEMEEPTVHIKSNNEDVGDYDLRLRVKVTPNKNYTDLSELVVATFSSLSLTEQEQQSYKKNKMGTTIVEYHKYTWDFPMGGLDPEGHLYSRGRWKATTYKFLLRNDYKDINYVLSHIVCHMTAAAFAWRVDVEMNSDSECFTPVPTEWWVTSYDNNIWTGSISAGDMGVVRCLWYGFRNCADEFGSECSFSFCLGCRSEWSGRGIYPCFTYIPFVIDLCLTSEQITKTRGVKVVPSSSTYDTIINTIINKSNISSSFKKNVFQNCAFYNGD